MKDRRCFSSVEYTVQFIRDAQTCCKNQQWQSQIGNVL
jgi:hypothetical protein